MLINTLEQAMRDSDRWVVELVYLDSKGQRTKRVVSPIRMLAGGRFLALCLSREAPRQFYLDRCEQASIQPADQYVMPVPMEVAA